MDGRRFVTATALPIWALSVAVSAETYCLVVNSDELEFVAAAERGYLVKLTERTHDIATRNGVTALDGDAATPVRGLGRRGVWIVERDASPEQKQDRIKSLGVDGHMAYAAPLFSSSGEARNELSASSQPNLKEKR